MPKTVKSTNSPPGLPSDELRAAACLVRVNGSVDDLAKTILGNLASGVDDSFNISPVSVTASKLRPEIGAPEMKPDVSLIKH